MKKIFLFVAGIGAVPALAFLLVQPASLLRQPGFQTPLFVGAHPDPRFLSMVETSCANCHSFHTEWPAYSRVAPFSWLIESDVRTARRHMNFSNWQLYTPDQKSRLLAEIGSVVRSRIMPPARYTLLHPAAKLTAGQVDEIYKWTRTERKLLSASSGE